jgi:hypothetical protein
MLHSQEAIDHQWVERLVRATRAVCGQTAAAQLADAHLRALRASVEQACRVPTSSGWERKAVAHAEIFNVLSDLAADPLTRSELSGGTAAAYDLMIGAGGAADRITANSRRRFLARLRAAEWDEAALEMEKHLRILHFMGRLAGPAARGTAR